MDFIYTAAYNRRGRENHRRETDKLGENVKNMVGENLYAFEKLIISSNFSSIE